MVLAAMKCSAIMLSNESKKVERKYRAKSRETTNINPETGGGNRDYQFGLLRFPSEGYHFQFKVLGGKEMGLSRTAALCLPPQTGAFFPLLFGTQIFN